MYNQEYLDYEIEIGVEYRECEDGGCCAVEVESASLSGARVGGGAD